MRPAQELLLLVAACTVLYGSGLGDIPFYTRGEPREGLVVREMLLDGQWLVPARPGGEPARKPPLYYWLAAAALRVSPDAPELALRLPSVVLGTAAVVGTWATGRAIWGAAAGLPAALALATSFEWTRAATSARVDMALAAALTAVVSGWALALAGRGRGWAVLAAIGMALGALAKGPVALVLPALALGTVRLARYPVRPLHPVVALGAATVMAGLWYAVAFGREGAPFLDVVARENVLRFVDPESGRTGHAHGVAYLVPLALVGLLPWTPLLPLALVPLRERPRSPAAALAAAWVLTGIAFFSFAAAKRSVYLLPVYPALALLLGAGVAAAPAEGRLARAAGLGASLYAPVGLLLAVLAATLAAGLDVGAIVRAWLRPSDAAGATTLLRAAHAAAPWLAALAGVTIAVLPLVTRAVRKAAWSRLVLLVAALFVGWTACFDTLIHPAIARERSLAPFLAVVRRTVPPDGVLYTFFPPDPGLRFYASPALRPWPRGGAPSGGYLLLWEDEWRRARDARGHTLPIVAVSDASQSGRGHLALVMAPRGAVIRHDEPAGPPAPPGLRTGNRPR